MVRPRITWGGEAGRERMTLGLSSLFLNDATTDLCACEACQALATTRRCTCGASGLPCTACNEWAVLHRKAPRESPARKPPPANSGGPLPCAHCGTLFRATSNQHVAARYGKRVYCHAECTGVAKRHQGRRVYDIPHRNAQRRLRKRLAALAAFTRRGQTHLVCCFCGRQVAVETLSSQRLAYYRNPARLYHCEGSVPRDHRGCHD